MKKRAQEEIVGFALILIIVAVILLVFLGISLNKPKTTNTNSYEVESFMQSCLQYTTDCEIDYEYADIQRLIFACNNNQKCMDNRDSCDVLKKDLKEITEESWPVGENSVSKGYELNISAENTEILNLKKGNSTQEYKGTVQELPDSIEILFRVYY